MTAFLFHRYFKIPGSFNGISALSRQLPVILRKMPARLCAGLFALALASDPLLWINIKTGWQQLMAYYQLIKK